MGGKWDLPKLTAPTARAIEKKVVPTASAAKEVVTKALPVLTAPAASPVETKTLPVLDLPTPRPAASRSSSSTIEERKARTNSDSRVTTKANFPKGPTEGVTRGDKLLDHVHGAPDKDLYPAYPYAQYSGFSNSTITVDPPKPGPRFPYRNVIWDKVLNNVRND